MNLTFTKHVKPQAGFIGEIYGYSFLVSVNLKELKPQKQFKLGIPSNEIQCKKEFELILKSSDDSPVCLTSETKKILIERGWAKPV